MNKDGTYTVYLKIIEPAQPILELKFVVPNRQIAKDIYKLFNKRCCEYKEKYKLNFGVYNTPAENLCFTAMKNFRAKYGIIPNVSDREYFTNSMHVPVWKDMNPFEKVDIESQLTGYSNAG